MLEVVEGVEIVEGEEGARSKLGRGGDDDKRYDESEFWISAISEVLKYRPI